VRQHLHAGVYELLALLILRALAVLRLSAPRPYALTILCPLPTTVFVAFRVAIPVLHIVFASVELVDLGRVDGVAQRSKARAEGCPHERYADVPKPKDADDRVPGCGASLPAVVRPRSCRASELAS
jgi:hypothetical protein